MLYMCGKIRLISPQIIDRKVWEGIAIYVIKGNVSRQLENAFYSRFGHPYKLFQFSL